MHTSPPAGGRRLFKPTARPARPPTTTVVLQASKRTTHAHVEAFTYTLPTHKHRDTDTQTHTDIHARTHTHAHTHTHTTSTHHNDVPCSPHRQLGTAHETCVHRVATFMATCSNIVVVSVIIVLIEHCKDPSFTRWPHFSPSWTFRDHPSRLLTVTHSIMCTLPRCAISHSFDGLPARLDVLGSRPDHRRARAFELSPRSPSCRGVRRRASLRCTRQPKRFKGSEKIPSALPRRRWRGSQTALRTKAHHGQSLQDSKVASTAAYHRLTLLWTRPLCSRRSRPSTALASRKTAFPRPQCRR